MAAKFQQQEQSLGIYSQGAETKAGSQLGFHFYSVLDQNPLNGAIPLKVGFPASVDPA